MFSSDVWAIKKIADKSVQKTFPALKGFEDPGFLFENLELFAFAVQEKSQITTGIARLDDINMTLLPPGVIGVGEGMGDQRGQVAISDIIYPTLANFRHAMKFIMVELKVVCSVL